MFNKQLAFSDLSVSPVDVYRQMGYGRVLPEESTRVGVERLLSEANDVVRPQFSFVVLEGQLGAEWQELSLCGTTLSIGRIIGRQLRGAEAFALFVATAGHDYDRWRQRSDAVEAYLADAIGSVVAERCADAMESSLQATVEKLGWKLTNRFSPGYCQWPVSDQHRLFALIGSDGWCGVRLTDMALMVPVKSVSGVVGVGKACRRNDYPCQLCSFDRCFRRRLPLQ